MVEFSTAIDKAINRVGLCLRQAIGGQGSI